MNREEFWRLIERTHSGPDIDLQMENLEQVLSEYPPEELISFEEHLSELLRESYSWELWGAAYIINGGCSDDGFDYFRGWLIAQGKATYEKAMANPDSLADLPDLEEDVECEDIWYLASRIYEEKTDQEMPQPLIETSELGESWDFEDDTEMQSRYPKLFARFWLTDSDDEDFEEDSEWDESE